MRRAPDMGPKTKYRPVREGDFSNTSAPAPSDHDSDSGGVVDENGAGAGRNGGRFCGRGDGGSGWGRGRGRGEHGRGRGEHVGGRGRGGGYRGSDDWTCQRCAQTVFASRTECFRCHAPRPDPNTAPTRDDVPAETISRKAKHVRDALCRDGEAVDLVTLTDKVMLQFGVRFVSELRHEGRPMRLQDVAEFERVRVLEGQLEMQISAFVEARLVATLADLHDALAAAHGKASFDELRVGPLLRQPLVHRNFMPASELRDVPPVRVADVVHDVSEFRRELGFGKDDGGRTLRQYVSTELPLAVQDLAAKTAAAAETAPS